MGMNGPVVFLGDVAAGFAHALLARALAVHPRMSVDTQYPDILTAARATKEPDEIERDPQSGSRRGGGDREGSCLPRLARANGRELPRERLGVRSRSAGCAALIHEEFLAHGLAEDGESIVSQGRDAGVPHNRGNDAEPRACRASRF